MSKNKININFVNEIDSSRSLDTDEAIKSLSDRLEYYLEDSFELGYDFTDDFKAQIIQSLIVEFDVEYHRELIERDVFSPISGHGTVPDGYDETEDVYIEISFKNNIVDFDFIKDFGYFLKEEFFDDVSSVSIRGDVSFSIMEEDKTNIVM